MPQEVIGCPAGDWNGQIEGPSRVVPSNVGVETGYKILDNNGNVVHDCTPSPDPA